MSYIAAAYNKAFVDSVRKALMKYTKKKEVKIEDILRELLNDQNVKNLFGESKAPCDDLLKVVGMVKAAHRILGEELDRLEKEIKEQGQKQVHINANTLVFGAELLSAAYKLAKRGELRIEKLPDTDPRKEIISSALERASEEIETLRDTFEEVGGEEILGTFELARIHALNLRAMIGDKNAQKELIKRAEEIVDSVGGEIISKEDGEWYLKRLELPKETKEHFLNSLKKIDHPYQPELTFETPKRRPGSNPPYAI